MKIRLFRSVLTVSALILTVACILSFTSCTVEFNGEKTPQPSESLTDNPVSPDNTEPDGSTGAPIDTDSVTTPDTDKTTETDFVPTPDTDKTTETEFVPTPDTDKTTETEFVPTPDTDKTTETESVPTPDTDAATEPDHKHSYTAKVTPPTCDKEGYTTYSCSCGDGYKADTVKALGHDIKTSSIAPTCTEPGHKTGKCSRCGYTVTESLPATGHSFTKKVTAPTCTDQGYTTYTCTCGYSEKGDFVKAAGHSFGEWRTVIEATGTSEGSEVRNCLNCSESEQRTVPRLENIPTDFVAYEGNSIWGYTYLSKQTNADNLKAFYRALDRAAREFNVNYENVTDERFVIATVSYADYALTSREAITVYKVFTLDTPRYYWLAKQYYHNSTHVTLCVDDEYATGTVRKGIAADISSFIAQFKLLAQNYSTTSEKALAVHDEIIRRIDYKYEADGITPINTVWAHNILGVVHGLGGVCEAYAETFQLVLSALGIDCITVHGSAPTAHAWSTVKFEDGKWYNIDVTWDDLANGNVTYIYFGQSHTEFVKTHKAYSSTSDTAEYMFDYPTPQSDYDLSPVTLYKNGALIGRFVSFNTAFIAMTDASADYTVEMDDYYNAFKLYNDIPGVRSVKFKGVLVESGSSYYITALQFQRDITSGASIILEDIALESAPSASYTLNILSNTVTTTGGRVNLNNGLTVKGDSLSKLVALAGSKVQLGADIAVGSVTVEEGATCIVLNGSCDVSAFTVGKNAITVIYDIHPIVFNADQLVFEEGGQLQLRGNADTSFTVGSVKGSASYAFLILIAESAADLPRITFEGNSDIPLYFAFWPESDSFDIKSYDGVIFTAPALSTSKVAFFIYENGTFVHKRDLFVLQNGECRPVKG